MRWVPLPRNMFLFHSLDAHGVKRDSKRLFYFTLDELLDSSVPAIMPTQEKVYEWQKETDRLN